MVLCITILGDGVIFFFNFVLICGDESEHVLRYVFLKITVLENIKGVAFHLPRANNWKTEVLSVDVTLPVLRWDSDHAVAGTKTQVRHACSLFITSAKQLLHWYHDRCGTEYVIKPKPLYLLCQDPLLVPETGQSVFGACSRTAGQVASEKCVPCLA